MDITTKARAMSVFCRYRACEFSAFALAEPVIAELFEQINLALSSDNASYFAHLMAALIHYDLRGDFNGARVHAETALSLNPSFSQAIAMNGIARIHLGDVTEGLQLLRNGIEAAADDPHRFRHLRELALGYLINDELARAAETVDKLIHQAPDLLRNELIAAPVFWQAGRQTDAKQRIARLLSREPGVTLTTMRPTQIGNAAVAAMMTKNLIDAGLPG
jgi:tetratricopeptide (TPR) repeat protein